MDLRSCAAIVAAWVALCIGCGWIAGQMAQWLAMP